MRDIDDIQLLRNWQAGDPESGVELVRRHHDNLSRFLCDNVGDDAGREIAQDVFLTLCERRGDFREESTFRAYLFGIARWKMVEYFRRTAKQKLRFDPQENSILDAGPSVTEIVERKVENSAIVHGLRALALDDQVILELHYNERLTNPEVAAIFEVPVGTIASRIRRARERLEEVVKVEFAPGEERPAKLTETSLHAYWAQVHEAWRRERFDEEV